MDKLFERRDVLPIDDAVLIKDTAGHTAIDTVAYYFVRLIGDALYFDILSGTRREYCNGSNEEVLDGFHFLRDSLGFYKKEILYFLLTLAGM